MKHVEDDTDANTVYGTRMAKRRAKLAVLVSLEVWWVYFVCKDQDYRGKQDEITFR